MTRSEPVMTIVHATDFSEPAAAAESRAVRLAKVLDADLVYLHVATEAPLYGETPFAMGDVRGVYESQRRWAQGELQARVDAARAAGVRARALLRVGVAHAEILKAAGEEHAEMVVLGTHGRTGLDRLLLGSVAERVVRLAHCPVLTVRPPEGEGGQYASQRAHAARRRDD
ncbi:MAG TPA: universal stress protein [Methylomirabilota bacterium]|nr:universal stress protein [Methylomirabilota bacterium]